MGSEKSKGYFSLDLRHQKLKAAEDLDVGRAIAISGKSGHCHCQAGLAWDGRCGLASMVFALKTREPLKIYPG